MQLATTLPRIWGIIADRLRPQRDRTAAALALELEFHRGWLRGTGGVDEAAWRRQNHALFVALSDDERHRARVAEMGIDAFISESGPQIDDAFDQLWRRPFAGRNLLDVGCGSRLRTIVFQDSRITCIDPLLDEYRRLNAGAFAAENVVATFANPAETTIPTLHDSQDLVFCWNVLDHCTDWRRVLCNVAGYLRPGGIVILGTDCHVHDKIHAPIDGGGAAIERQCRRHGLRLAYPLPAAALSRDWAAVFRKSEH